jgi:adenine-specific DNA-methyltransferase
MTGRYSVKDMSLVSLRYPGKLSREEIYKIVSPAKLVIVKEFMIARPLVDDGWRNMVIWGDNLEVLRALIEDSRVKGKVRLVYIDPPFGTGNIYKGSKHVSARLEDEIAYHDMPLSPEYLEFLRRRLILLHDILAEDGSIYVHIDVDAVHYVKILMDEIFGIENFVNDIARVKCNPKNFKRKAYGNIRDSILFYAKNFGKHVWNEPREPYTEEDIERLFPKIDKDGRRYTTVPLHAPGETRNGPTGQMWRGMKPPPGRHWRYPPEVLDELDKKGLIEWSKSGNPRLKIYADEYIVKGKRMQDVWLNFKDPPYPTYPTEKNLDMVMKIIETSSNPGDIVLDAFCGSGTTAVAAEKLNRRWICIDISPVAIEVTVRRLLELKSFKPFVLINATGKPVNENLMNLIEKR